MAVRVDMRDLGSAKTTPAGQGVQLGLFTLYPEQHLLHRAGEPVRIGSRALSLLIALVEKRGELVSKEALIARVWPDTFVEEANLRVHIAALRKVLGDTADPPQYIANVSGRGYRLVAALRADEADGPRTATLIAERIPPKAISARSNEKPAAHTTRMKTCSRVKGRSSSFRLSGVAPAATLPMSTCP